MATKTITAAGDVLGPINGKKGVICLTGTMTAGGIIIYVRPAAGDAYYPSDYIDVAKLQRVPDSAGTGYGYVSEFTIGTGGDAKAIASAAFVGSLTGFMGPAS